MLLMLVVSEYGADFFIIAHSSCWKNLTYFSAMKRYFFSWKVVSSCSKISLPLVELSGT